MKSAHFLVFHWGWLSPACWSRLRIDQGTGYLDYLKSLPPATLEHVAFTHAGWLFDQDMASEVRSPPGKVDEPRFRVAPFSPDEIAAWRRLVAEGRLEPVTYYYMPVVADQFTGELVIRAIRYARDVIVRNLGFTPIAMAGHDPFTMMQWGTPQQVQFAALTGHKYLIGGTDGIVVGMDGTTLPCVGVPLQRHGIEAMADTMTQRLETNLTDHFYFATELHWHHRTNPLIWAIEKTQHRVPDLVCTYESVSTWDEHPRERPLIPATGVGVKGWNGGGPNQMQLGRLVRKVELCLPGIEAIDALVMRGVHHEAIHTLWKRCLYLADNHIRWLVHDVKRVYLPVAEQLVADVTAIKSQLLAAISPQCTASTIELAVWNLLGWKRTVIIETEIELPLGYADLQIEDADERTVAHQIKIIDEYPNRNLAHVRLLLKCDDIPAWSCCVLSIKPKVGLPDARHRLVNPPTSLLLENEHLRIEFASSGEIEQLIDKRTGAVRRGGNRLVNLAAESWNQESVIRAGQPLATQTWDGPGCFHASAEVDIPEIGDYVLALDVMEGCNILVDIEIIGRDGVPVTPKRRIPRIGLHWMAALPRRADADRIDLGELAAGVQVRVTLWFLSEGKSMLGFGTVSSRRHTLAIQDWRVQWDYRLRALTATEAQAEMIESGPLRQRIRFQGKLANFTYETVASLAHHTTQIDFATRFFFSEATPLGLHTPPLPMEIGSYLGSNCERPYVPGLMVTFPAPPEPRLLVDSAAALRDPLNSVAPALVEHSWLAGHAEPVRDFWWGITPIAAVRMAIIKDWGALIADGLPHFLLWKGLTDNECMREHSPCSDMEIGISFGASLIHPRTVSKRIGANSPWFEFGRGPGYADFADAYEHYEFNHPIGVYQHEYSLCLETDASAVWRRTYEIEETSGVVVLHPQQVSAAPDHPALALPAIDAENIMLTACEYLGGDEAQQVLRIRLMESDGRATTCRLSIQHTIVSLECCELSMTAKQIDKHTIVLTVPGHAVREVQLTITR